MPPTRLADQPLTSPATEQFNCSQPLDEFSRGEVIASPCWAAPVISHGLMYIRGKDQWFVLS